MATPSFTALISGVVDGLKSDSRLTGVVNDEFIYYGPEGNIPSFPAITVELTQADEPWKTFPQGKDMESTITIRIYDEAYDYVTGLQSVEDISRRVSDILQARTGFSGLVYQAYPQTKNFVVYDVDNVPILACEMELLTKARFAPASN